MFIGRKEELKRFKSSFENGQTIALLYGKRRVGKTALLREIAKLFKGEVVYAQCAETSIKENIDNLTKQVSKVEKISLGRFDSFDDLFASLSTLDKKILVIIDEYSYLKSVAGGRAIDSIFQRIIGSLNPKISLILCGSYIRLMNELNSKGNPLFGRFNLIQELLDMDYRQSAEFYPHLSADQKIRFYSVFGGSPFANSNLNIKISLKENIKNLLLEPGSVLRNYVENILTLEFSKGTSQNILEVLNNKKKRYSDLEKSLGLKTSGLLDKRLKPLLENDIIEKICPINKSKDRSKTFYSIKDPLALFYYTFIFPNRNSLNMLGPENFYASCIKDKIEDYIHFRFEDIVREYLVFLARRGKLKGVLDIGKYWYDDPKSHKNGEFDVAIKNQNNTYDIFEVKYLNKRMTKKQADHEIEQIKAIPFLKINKIGFASLNGFDFEDASLTLIKGEDLYK